MEPLGLRRSKRVETPSVQWVGSMSIEQGDCERRGMWKDTLEESSTKAG